MGTLRLRPDWVDSLSTVFTWLRSRACAGMQGLGVLALVVVAPCGFACRP